LVASGVTENTAMGWQDASRNTVGRNWGKPPSLVEPIALTIELPRGAVLPSLYRLDDRGQRKGVAAATSASDRATRFQIGPPHGTIWYEIDYAGGN
jgi:hypothetical protein